jgi:hypothetical protein
VVHRVVDHHDLPADVHRVRQVIDTAHEARQHLGDHRLAVPGVAENEQGFGRVDGRAEALDVPRVEDHVAESRQQPLARHVHMTNGLLLDPRPVVFERHRRRPDILPGRHRFARAVAAGGRQVEDVSPAPGPRGPLHLEQPLVLQLDELLVHDGEGQTDRFDQLLTAASPLDVEGLEQQLHDRFG